jgi:DNA-binding MarR family transcriptional regulator
MRNDRDEPSRSALSPSASIESELKQARPFKSPENAAMIALLLTADRVRGRLRDFFAAKGDLTMQQYNVLRILRGAGERGLPTLEIADRMIERMPGITRLLDRLDAKGLVQRDRATVDRRQVFCRITPSGLELLAQLDVEVDDLVARLFARLDRRATEGLLASLETVRAQLRSEYPETLERIRS